VLARATTTGALPRKANLPHGVEYRRNANFKTGTPIGVDNRSRVHVSIDPFSLK
jgi:hypothetical protein